MCSVCAFYMLEHVVDLVCVIVPPVLCCLVNEAQVNQRGSEAEEGLIELLIYFVWTGILDILG